MHFKPAFVAFVALLQITAATGLERVALPPAPTPQSQESLRPMLTMDWSAGRPMPQGMQDNHVNLMGNWVVSVLGFCSGADDDWKPGKYPRGFLNKAWALNLEDEAAGWIDLPPFPGAPRQAGNGASVDGALYLWGGFSYDAPYTCADGFKLTHTGDAWNWEPLPPLPSPTCWSGISVVGKKIYALGGADYDAQAFYCLQDRTGTIKGLGQRLIMFDTENPEAGWTEKSRLPGTARCLTGTPVVDGKIYVLGGISMLATGAYANVVDNWRYDPASNLWERLRDHPVSASGSSSSTTVFANRYVLLPASYQYGVIANPDGSEGPAYGTPQKVTRTWENHPSFANTHYYNHHYVYDIKTDSFGTATSLPFDDVASITVVRGDTAYLFPGETAGFYWEGEYFGHRPEFTVDQGNSKTVLRTGEYFGHHPEFVLKGRISGASVE